MQIIRIRPTEMEGGEVDIDGVPARYFRFIDPAAEMEVQVLIDAGSHALLRQLIGED